MPQLKPNDIARVKAMGFLINRGTECFSGRIVAPGTVFTSEDFSNIAALAAEYGNGKVICTSRLAVEIPGIPYDKIEAAQEFAKAHGMRFGGTGNKIRPVAACKGTTCIYGNCDTQGIAKKIHEDYYLGWNNVALPHKFKITVGGCPNSCMKPSLNDFGVEGHKIPVYNEADCRGCKVCMIEKSCPMKAARLSDGKLCIDDEVCKTCGVCTGKCPFKAVAHTSETLYQIYVGGTWGKRTRKGTPLSHLVTEEEIFPLLEKTLLWFKENAYSKERLGMAIDRIGADFFEKAITGNDLLDRKDEILAKDILQRT